MKRLTEALVPEVHERGCATKADSILATASSFAHAQAIRSASTVFNDSLDGEKVAGYSSLSVSTCIDNVLCDLLESLDEVADVIVVAIVDF